MPSRRVFKDRILREARAQQTSVVLDLTLSLSALTAASPLAALDRIPILTSGGQARYVLGSTARNYVLGIAGGTANIPENLAVIGTVTGGTYNGQTISAAASLTGTLTVASTLVQNGISASLAQNATGNATLLVGLGTQTAGSFVRIQRAAGQYGMVVWRTGTSERWAAYIDNTAESGGNVGGEWSLAAHSDAGAFIDNVVRIQRFAGGTVSWTRPNLFPAATTSIPSIRLPHGTAPSAPTNGDVWTTTAGLFARINGTTVGPYIDATASITGSAATLTTSRNIWGQAFNGSADVTGALTGVTDLTASGTGSFATRLFVGTTTSATGTPVLDVVGSVGMILSDITTDASTKIARVGSRHATNAEEPFGWLIGTSTTTLNNLRIGGGSASLNAATSVDFYTAANSTTTVGTLRGTITSTGTFSWAGDATFDGGVTLGNGAGDSHTINGSVSITQTATLQVGAILNESGANSDTRIEGDTLTHAFLLDAGQDSIGLFGSAVPNFQSGRGIAYLANATTVPTGDPSGGGFLYVEGGALKFRGSSGTITTIALA